MTIHERLMQFWAGERPDQIPYTIYYWEWRHVRDDPAWQPMYDDGLGVTFHLAPYGHEPRNVATESVDTTEGGAQIHREIRRTPIGEISATWVDGWHRDYWLKTRQDYRVMTYIVEQTQVVARLDRLEAEMAALPPFGIPLLALGRTPLQTILVDMAGLEAFGAQLFDFESEIRGLYDALLRAFARQAEIVAQAPGRFVSNLENFTAETLGPRRYREFLLPVYQTYFPALHAAGKIVGSHYDGQTAACRALIAESPIDLIESLTPPPEGDLTLAQARVAWPERLFWSNLNVALYQLPPAELRRIVLERCEEGAVDGRGLAFEVSEHLPQNWERSMPVVLDALKETRS